MLQECRHVQFGLDVGVNVTSALCPFAQPWARRPDWPNWNGQHCPPGVFIEPKNPSGHIIPEHANFALGELFGIKKANYHIIISNYVVKHTINDQEESVTMSSELRLECWRAEGI